MPPYSTKSNSTEYSRVEVVRSLLKAGTDPALAEEHGLTPLHRAAQNGHIDMVDMLYMGAPATLNLCTHNDDTPLSVACYVRTKYIIISSKCQFCSEPANLLHTFTIVVGSTDENTFRTEGKGRTTTITLADGKLLPCIATRVCIYSRDTRTDRTTSPCRSIGLQ